MTRKSNEAKIRDELKRLRNQIDYYTLWKKKTLQYGQTTEVNILSACIKNFKRYEQRLLNILDGYKMQKTGNAYFTKDANRRYIDRSE